MPAPPGSAPANAAGPISVGEIGVSDDWRNRVGRSWADNWQATDRSFGALTDRLLAIASQTEFAQALDIGCGAGELCQRLGRANASSRVIGVDVSQDLVAVARDRTAALPNVRIEHGDAADWQPGAGERPDLLVSRHGVMFFADPVAAFTHLRKLAAPKARLTFSCFRERSKNEWAQALASAVPATGEAPTDPRAPGPFAFGEGDYISEILAQSGWRNVTLERFDYAMIAGQVGAEDDDPLDSALAYFLRIGPAASRIAALEGTTRTAAIARLRTILCDYRDGDRIALPASAWIVTAEA